MDMKKRLLTFAVVMTAAGAAGIQPASAQNAQSANAQTTRLPYQNPDLSPEERAADLVSRLTLQEKTLLMMDDSRSIPRLRVPAFHWWSEALHGVGRNGTATVFPITIGMAASFDDALLYRVFTAVSDEARAKYMEAKLARNMHINQCLSFWTPNINIFRDPRWGRGQETYGEDPYLTTRMGLAVVNGLQGQSFTGEPSPTKYVKLLACAKHFAVHSGPEWNRHTFNIEQLPERDLWETYLPAFKALVQKGHVAEVMCAYQRIDGAPCCANARYERQILRDEWGFKGLITSDCGAISDFHLKGHHETAANEAEATAQAIGTGTDLECGDVYRALPEAVAKGLIDESKVDVSLKRLLTARFRLGDFDNDDQVSWNSIPSSVIACADHKALAARMAEESIVLLQNKASLLPLKTTQRLVVMGPNANDSVMQWGNYNGFPTSTTTILQGINHMAGAQVRHIAACTHTRYITASGDTVSYDATRDAAKIADYDRQLLAQVGDADVVVFAGGISPRLEGEEMDVPEPGFRGGDRTDIELPAVQRHIIVALHRAGKRVVMVCCSGSAIALTPECQNADAIVQAWYGGERGGEAVAKVLFGEVNPSGKLPVTFYKSTADLPDFLDYTMANRTYRYFKGEALFPFGHGLSYTTFAYGKPKYADGKLTFMLKNTGKRAGTETTQVYIKRNADADGPIKSLKAFKRVSLKAGESTIVEIPLTRESFECWDKSTNTMTTLPGQYTLYVGGSSAAKACKSVQVVL